uniref:Capsid protein n=1 Tax=Turnip yellow mosaic virus TaxID=12154 RepID=O89520_TYMV|nr:virion protein [Turnip yellow mosaic virus]
MDIDRQTAPQDQVITIPSLLNPPPGSQPPIIRQPFQCRDLNAGTKDATASITVASLANVSNLTALYRHASLDELWLTISPTHLAPAFPTQVRVCWVSANSPITDLQITNTYGGQIFCVGGSLNSHSPLEVKCPLHMMNRRVKDSVQYLDSPKLVLSVTAQPTPPTASTCIITVSGILSMHSPLITDTST